MLEKVRKYQLKHKNLKLIPITTENYWEIGGLNLRKNKKNSSETISNQWPMLMRL